MAYTKQTWENLPSQTTPINADRLTHIEDGIFDAAATADTAASDASSAISGLADKVDKVEGKGLSTNDFTDALKTKLDNIEAGAEVNVQSDWNQSDNSADDYIKNKPSLGTSAYKSSTSVVTDSTDLVESGAVKDIVGWGNKNIGVWNNVALSGDVTMGYKLIANGSSLIAPIKNNTNYTVSKKSTSYGNRFRIILFKNEPSFTITLEVSIIVNNSSELTEYTFNSGVYNYVVFTYESSDVITQDTAEAMIELGSVKTAYEPYHASVDATKCDNSVIGTVENGTTASQAYAVGSHFIRDGKFCTVTQAISSGGAISDSNTVDRPIADCLVYKAGDSIVYNCAGDVAGAFIGNVSSNRKTIHIFINTDKPIIANSVSLNKTGDIVFLVNNTSLAYDSTLHNISISILSGKQIRITFTKKDGTEFNATALSVLLSFFQLGTFTFTFS